MSAYSHQHAFPKADGPTGMRPMEEGYMPTRNGDATIPSSSPSSSFTSSSSSSSHSIPDFTSPITLYSHPQMSPSIQRNSPKNESQFLAPKNYSNQIPHAAVSPKTGVLPNISSPEIPQVQSSMMPNVPTPVTPFAVWKPQENNLPSNNNHQPVQHRNQPIQHGNQPVQHSYQAVMQNNGSQGKVLSSPSLQQPIQQPIGQKQSIQQQSSLLEYPTLSHNMTRVDLRIGQEKLITPWSKPPSYLQMPYSASNQYVHASNPNQVLQMWDYIQAVLLRQLNPNQHPHQQKQQQQSLQQQQQQQVLQQQYIFESGEALEKVIKSYNPRDEGNWTPFINLINFCSQNPYFLKETLPFIIKMALKLPEVFEVGREVPMMKKGDPMELIFSRLQCCSLLANMFLCTFPNRHIYGLNHNDHNNQKKEGEGRYPDVHFVQLFTADDPSFHQPPSSFTPSKSSSGSFSPSHPSSPSFTRSIKYQKLMCIVQYFNDYLEAEKRGSNLTDGLVLFRRQVLMREQYIDWQRSEMPVLPFVMEPTRSIENITNCRQADFANKFIGGGVLNRGCVQEEIRMLIAPEMIVSRLFCDELAANEAIVIKGSRIHSIYSGYGSTFEYSGPAMKIDNTSGVLGNTSINGNTVGVVGNTNSVDVIGDEVVAFDAHPFSKHDAHTQYHKNMLLRELNKAYIAFMGKIGEEKAIASGHWGCGAFNGNRQLKFLIQLAASSASGHPLIYCTMNEKDIENHLQVLGPTLCKMTVGELVRWIVSYGQHDSHSSHDHHHQSIFSYMTSNLKLHHPQHHQIYNVASPR